MPLWDIEHGPALSGAFLPEVVDMWMDHGTPGHSPAKGLVHFQL